MSLVNFYTGNEMKIGHKTVGRNLGVECVFYY